MTKNQERARCSDCGKEWNVDALDYVDNLSERIYPGEEVPAGQCPDCQACCHLIDDEEDARTSLNALAFRESETEAGKVEVGLFCGDDFVCSFNIEYSDAAKVREQLVEAMGKTRPGPLRGCTTCGCTDIQATAWFDINTDEMTNDEGPLDTVYCPQCEQHDNGSDEVEVLRPYDENRDIEAEGLL